MKESSKTLAFATGAATGNFTIAGRKFKNQPMYIKEVNEYLLDSTDKTSYLVERLNARLVDGGEPIDLEFLEGILTYADLGQVTQLLISGVLSGPN